MNNIPPVDGCLLPKPNPEMLKYIQRRTRAILSAGQFAEWVFVCGLDDGILTFQPEAGQKPLMLFFTTPFAASDYLRVTKAAAKVRQIRFDRLPENSAGWVTAGTERFLLNRCPRCNVMLPIPMDVMRSMDRLRQVWAAIRATQLCLGERTFREFIEYSKTSRPRARTALDQIRDHIDCSSPYLHELIAFFAHMDGDEEAKAIAIERLQEFGPEFSAWDTKWESNSFVSALVTATLGLGMSFGVEMKTKPS